MEKSDCNTWMLPTQRVANVDQILAKRPMRIAYVPELLALLDETRVKVYPYHKTFDEAISEPIIVLHTSGSTGLPKPVIVKNGLLATLDAQHLLPEIEGRKPQSAAFCYPHRSFSTFPNFHVSLFAVVFISSDYI